MYHVKLLGGKMRLPGNRIVKTTVAVFMTALLCLWIGWPPVFAVITAVVTLEPTAADSIKKGIIRFPASAIGSFYAVLFISLFGNSAITYTLAASLTILTCYQLRLHAGLLVATITAVAMVEVIHDNYFMSFFIRLGTTSIGIVVSTLVNMFILPPNYMKDINKNIKQIYQNLMSILLKLIRLKLYVNDKENFNSDIKLEEARKSLRKTEELIRFQGDEFNFLNSLGQEKQENFPKLQSQIYNLKLMHYHISNISDVEIDKSSFLMEKVDLLTNVTIELENSLNEESHQQLDDYEQKLKLLLDLYWQKSNPSTEQSDTSLPHELIFLYEVISVFYLAKQYQMERLKD